jgi:hypothetical protein
VNWDNSNGYFNGWYWTKSTEYSVPSNPAGNDQLVGWEVVTSAGTTWKPNLTRWDYDTGEEVPILDQNGVPYTYEEAIAEGAYAGYPSWTASQTDDGGVQYPDGLPDGQSAPNCPGGSVG